MENSGLSSIPVSSNADCNENKIPSSQDENVDVPNLSSHQVDASSTEQVKEQENTDKVDKKEKRVLKKKSPFLPGNMKIVRFFIMEVHNLFIRSNSVIYFYIAHYGTAYLGFPSGFSSMFCVSYKLLFSQCVVILH